MTKRQVKDLQAVDSLTNEAIDLTDIPAAANWKDAAIGKFYRPGKHTVTIHRKTSRKPTAKASPGQNRLPPRRPSRAATEERVRA